MKLYCHLPLRRAINGVGKLTAFTALAVSVAHGQANMSVGSTRGFAGAVVNIPLLLNSRSNIVGFQADILHDAVVLTSGAAVPGASSGGATLRSYAPQAGTRRLLIYSATSGALSNGVVAEVPFAVAPNVYSGFYRLSLTNVIVATAAAQPLVSTNRNGVIALSPVFLRVDGGVDFVLAVTPVQTYLVQASTNLVDWLTLSTNVAVSPYLEFSEADVVGVYPYRFYRAVPVLP